jgi:nitrate reductase gamma subunit
LEQGWQDLRPAWTEPRGQRVEDLAVRVEDFVDRVDLFVQAIEDTLARLTAVLNLFQFPHWVCEPFVSPAQKQLLAIGAGGVAGFFCFIGLSMLLHRRIFDPRIRLTSHRTDLMILVVLWVQLVLGLFTLPFSLVQSDGSVMLHLSAWGQGIVTLQPNAGHRSGLDWPYLVHLVLGMSIFLLCPFSLLVRVWSGFGTLAYALRPYQVVRSRRLGVSSRGR